MWKKTSLILCALLAFTPAFADSNPRDQQYQYTGTPTGTGAPVNQNSPTISGLTTSGTLTISGAASFTPANLSFTISPTGTGTVTINPSTAGTINNMSIGATTASTGAFTTLSASSTVSGTGFSTYLASPPAIGGTAAAAGSFTTLTASTSETITSSNSSALSVGQTGATNPAFVVNANNGVGTGWSPQSFSAGNAARMAVISSGTNEAGYIIAKGTAQIQVRNANTTSDNSAPVLVLNNTDGTSGDSVPLGFYHNGANIAFLTGISEGTNTQTGHVDLYTGNAGTFTKAFWADNSGNFAVNAVTGTPQAALDDQGGTFLVRGGTLPSSSSCGSSPSFSGSNSSFKVTVGSGTVTSCVIADAFNVAPNACELTPANATAAAVGTTSDYISALSTTGLTITGTGLAGAAYYVHCF